MAFTRAELQNQIDTLLVDNHATQCSRSLLNGLLSNILNSVTLQDESANPIEVAGINITDPVIGVKVVGVKVLGEQGSISGLLPGTDAISLAVNDLTNILLDHGLIKITEV